MVVLSMGRVRSCNFILDIHSSSRQTASRRRWMSDFRSDAMDSREGRGRARAAWDSYQQTVGEALLPLLRPAIERFAASQGVDLLGFWLSLIHISEPTRRTPIS